MTYILKTTLCFILILITAFFLGNISAYEIGVEGDNIISPASQTQFTTSFEDTQKPSMETQNPFYWHLTWLGVVLSICGLIGLSALFRKLLPTIKKGFKLSHSKTSSKHIPTPW